MDYPSALMITEMGRIGRKLRDRGHTVASSVTAEEYQHYFKSMNENTSSSPSGLHLGHDKAAAQSDALSDIFALQMNTIVRTGIHPSRWGVALQVMLEKIAGICLVDKLRSIQLYEADYNWFNKFIFNDGTLRALELTESLPEEHFSHRGNTAEDACFDKTLTVDISRQSRTPMALISVDAAQCYDRVNHNMMGLVWLALQVPIQAITIITTCLQYMKIFTRTGWGDSCTHFGGPNQDTPFCGLGQGSKAAPASWLQLSSIIVNPNHRCDFAHGACWTKCYWETIQHFQIDMRIQYASLPLQRLGDMSIMEFLLPHLNTPSVMAAVNRCRCHLNMIYLSDITSLDGKYISSDVVWGNRPILQSRFRFPPEHPTSKDWLIWVEIWTAATRTRLALTSPLGSWTRPPHFTWPWRYNSDLREIYILQSEAFCVYKQPHSILSTRSTSLLHPTTRRLQTITGVCVTLDCVPSPTGPRYHSPVIQECWPSTMDSTTVLTFWDHIMGWGGLWMWEMIFPDVGLGFDISWMITSLRAGTLVAVTDGSYDRQRSPRVCAAGWIIADITTGSRLAGSFSEYSSSASSYRGELLGLCTINIILLALSITGDIVNRPPITIWCDNKGAINRASDKSRRIKCGRPCADILRILRSIRHELPLSTSFRHVKAHMDDRLSWEQLSLEQKLNCDCDTLAKSAVSRAINSHREQAHCSTDTLPKEAVAIYVNKQKITSDPTNSLRYLLGKSEAKLFLTSEQGWTADTFDSVGWDWLHLVLSSKPVMFRLWLGKQHSNFCATGVQMKRCKMSDDDRCPSCWGPRERARHLCICPSESRTKLFHDNVSELEAWLTLNDNTDSELAYWLIKYILGRGSLRFAELGSLSPDLHQAAISQDKIGWRNMMEGRISRLFYGIQCQHLSKSHSRINGDDWMRGLINRLIHITHSQWLFRNFTLHDSIVGYNRLKDKLAVQLQIEELSHTDPERIPEHSRFLLEIDTEILKTKEYEPQVYWVTAMEAARQARATAILYTTASRPALSTVGAFTIQEAIRREIGEMFGNRRTDDNTIRQPLDTRNIITGLTESDRQRKPD